MRTDMEVPRSRPNWEESLEEPGSRRDFFFSFFFLSWAMWLLIDTDNYLSQAYFVFGQKIHNKKHPLILLILKNCRGTKKGKWKNNLERRWAGSLAYSSVCNCFGACWSHAGDTPLRRFPNASSSTGHSHPPGCHRRHHKYLSIIGPKCHKIVAFIFSLP